MENSEESVIYVYEGKIIFVIPSPTADLNSGRQKANATRLK